MEEIGRRRGREEGDLGLKRCGKWKEMGSVGGDAMRSAEEKGL